MISLFINSKPCRLLLDTGSVVSLLKPEILELTNLNQPNEDIILSGISGLNQTALGTLTAKVGSEKLPNLVNFEFVVCNIHLEADRIIGRDFLSEFNADISYSKNQLIILNEKFPILKSTETEGDENSRSCNIIDRGKINKNNSESNTDMKLKPDKEDKVLDNPGKITSKVEEKIEKHIEVKVIVEERGSLSDDQEENSGKPPYYGTVLTSPSIRKTGDLIHQPIRNEKRETSQLSLGDRTAANKIEVSEIKIEEEIQVHELNQENFGTENGINSDGGDTENEDGKGTSFVRKSFQKNNTNLKKGLRFKKINTAIGKPTNIRNLNELKMKTTAIKLNSNNKQDKRCQGMVRMDGNRNNTVVKGGTNIEQDDANNNRTKLFAASRWHQINWKKRKRHNNNNRITRFAASNGKLP